MLLHACSQWTKTFKIDSKVDIDIDDTVIPSVLTTKSLGDDVLS